jgi:hypothetical protein
VKLEGQELSAPVSQQPRNHSLAVPSIILGKISFVSAFAVVLPTFLPVIIGLLAGISAIVCGVIAGFKVRQNPENYGGGHLARRGRRFGYAGCILLQVLFFVCPAGCGAPHAYGFARLYWPYSFKDVPMSKVVEKMNATVRLASLGMIKNVASIDTTPVKITNVNTDPNLESPMNQLIERYNARSAVFIKQGAQGYETCPVTEDFVPFFPLTCQMKGTGCCSAGMEVKETPTGLLFSRVPKELECRAYKISDSLLAKTDSEKKKGNIARDCEPVSQTFAWESDMNWYFMVSDGPGKGYVSEFALDAFTLYLPEQKQILVLQTPEGHAKIEKTLKKNGSWQD